MENQIQDHNLRLDELRSKLTGELLDSKMDRSMYATDASNYQITPTCIVLPKNQNDVLQTIVFARKHNLPVLARGGGTSLVGQTVGEGIVIDFTKYMDHILEFNPGEKWAWVEPGLVRDVLNDQIKKMGLHFAPDPATTSRATIGGMIANNSSGTRSILYGKTLDHVLELEVLLSDGTVIHTKPLDFKNLEAKLNLKNKEGELYRGLFQTVQQHKAEIIQRFPKVMRRVGGYNLDEFLEDDIWNLSKLIVGSESTLAIILKAKINLEPLPKHQVVCLVHFHEYFDSISHIAAINSFKPAAVELLDKMLLDLSKENLETRRYCTFIEGDPQAVLVVEFYGDSLEEANENAKKLVQYLQQKNIGYSWPIYQDSERVNGIFTLRKKGLGLLLGVKGKRKPIAIIEDAAVPVEHLADYIKEVFLICKKHNTAVVAYAHASVGLLHVKPLLDLRDGEDIKRMQVIAEDVLQLVIKYKGSWSGEHGDGLARGPYNEIFFGSQLYQCFIHIKKLFDPYHILNPGKIVESPSNEHNLRYGVQYKDIFANSKFHYRAEGGFVDAVHLCNGVGECRKHSGGTMCPSFRASKEEKDSTRGRANVLRMAMSGQLDEKGFSSPHVMEALSLCLACKACKSECPSNVDMAKLKSEMLYVHNSTNGLSNSSRLIKYQEKLSKLINGKLANPVNVILKNKFSRKIVEKLTGLDKRRILPLYAPSNFNSLISPKVKSNNKVVLFADTYIKYHDQEIGINAFELLEYLGYEVEIFSNGCCQRPAISKGLLDEAKKRGQKTLQGLRKYLEDNIPVVVCEPSCATALKDDLPDLMDDNDWQTLTKNIFLLEDFLASEKKLNKLNKEIGLQPGHYVFHGHCHQKAMFTTKAIHDLFQKNESVQFSEIDSGCCGMAGSFGYEKNNYDISQKIYEQSIDVPLSSFGDDVIILADGFSCRHQIEHFGDREVKHWLMYVTK